MTINFNGLATGIDTASLIDGLMEVERKPVETLKLDRDYQNARLDAYKTLGNALTELLGKVRDLAKADDLQGRKSQVTGEPLVSVSTTTSSAMEGSYQIKSFSFAQVEKDISQGYADKTAASFGTGTITVTVGGVSHDITIDSTNNSLEGIVGAINDANLGIMAAIINDGTTSPYRLVVSGKTAGDPADVGFDIDFSGLTGGSYANPVLTETQQASQAHVQVDGVDIYSNSNVFTDAIPGVTFSVDQADGGATTATLTVTIDRDATKNKIKSFVDSYNKIMTFVSSQSAKDGQNAGVLAGDAGMNSIKRRLQNLLTTVVDTGGSFQSLADLGLETQRDGTLVVDDTQLSDAIDRDLDSIVSLLAGNDTTEGIATKFETTLESLTDDSTGFLTSREESINRTIERINANIERIQDRLDKREQRLLDQFNAMETLVSALNAQGDYLTQQMTMLQNMWSKK
ncbi:flagellar hook-associated protein 2 [Geothermobacter ehrlichii]|uniref:Flagellar hook-associated protein 2 n=1 Tax=Geothermobacter ehrlichii TaxID=213224 RepID=A0A5D3WNM6_9BACT|nr:flagellar filament capping protein FliD [Geothermobacter ehrlichii]TYP00172.1 flagellar hook-associated protein 2 [Geothermobacter ehrlichii]